MSTTGTPEGAEARHPRAARSPSPAVRAARALLAVWATLVAAGCDPPPADVIAGAPVRADFGVREVNVRQSVLAAGEPLVVRFTRALDPVSVGPRTVQVAGAHRRRVSSASVLVRDDAIVVPADVVAAAAVGGPVSLRIEGGASPCALRAADGTPLPGRYDLALRIGPPGGEDPTGPVLLGSRPGDGEGEAASGSLVELRFSEPVVATRDSVTLLVDGAESAAEVRSSADRRRVVVRAKRPFTPGAVVSVGLHPCLADDAGNPLDAASPRNVTFRVRESPERVVEEDFTADEFLDRAASDCAWGEADAPGILAARSGQRPLAPLDPGIREDLGDRASVRFQMLVRGGETEGGVASGLRIRFAHPADAPPLLAAWVEAGPTSSDRLDPSFQGNRDAARLAVVARVEEPAAWDADGDAGAWADVPFELPVALPPDEAVLLDVTLVLEPGARVAAVHDAAGRFLVRDAERETAPAAEVLVVGARPFARSRWYDAGTDAPLWRAAEVRPAGGPAACPSVEFQAAPADGAGRPDAALASPWESDLSRLPAWRFVRFRVRFGGAAGVPGIDRIAMPFGVQSDRR